MAGMCRCRVPWGIVLIFGEFPWKEAIKLPELLAKAEYNVYLCTIWTTIVESKRSNVKHVIQLI